MNHYVKSRRDWYSKEILELTKSISPKVMNLNFIGSSSDIFIGKFNYPNVYTGYLAPISHQENADKLSMPEEWYKNNLKIEDIIKARCSLINSRFTSHTQSAKGKLIDTLKEVAMAKKPVDVEFFLKKKPQVKIDLDVWSPPVGNPAPLLNAVPQENISIHNKVENLVEDNYVKASDALMELHKINFSVSSMIKFLSAGLLGVKKERKLVPSRWSTTAVDNIISNNLIKDIKRYEWINDYCVFRGEYLGNSYTILLLPQEWSFEVIEFELGGNNYWQDYEDNYGRKNYAQSVTGAYYANRLAVAEYLHNKKKQAGVMFIREINKNVYWAPLGVGILREVSRDAFNKPFKKFSALNETFEHIRETSKIPLEKINEISILLGEKRQQTKLSSFFQ